MAFMKRVGVGFASEHVKKSSSFWHGQKAADGRGCSSSCQDIVQARRSQRCASAFNGSTMTTFSSSFVVANAPLKRTHLEGQQRNS
jgi:hypothetical protein